MVAVELAGDVVVSREHVEQVLVTATESTVTNLTVVQVGQSLVIVVSNELGGVIVVGVLNSVIVEFDLAILMGGQVGQGLYSVSVEAEPEIVTGGQVGQGLYTVVAEPDPGIVTGGQVGQGL